MPVCWTVTTLNYYDKAIISNVFINSADIADPLPRKGTVVMPNFYGNEHVAYASSRFGGLG